MNKRGLIAIVALSAASLLYAYTADVAASAAPLMLPAGEAHPPPAAETARIRAHLEEVERELLARDVSHLSEAQRTARAQHIRVLREYREAGVFPHNHDFPGERVPYFVDEHGTLCAMAYLISRSGRHDLVERVATSRNNARVRELANDPDLIAWLDAAGLTAAEAARIQPAYDGCCWVEPTGDENAVSADYATASALVGGVGGMSIGINLLRAEAAERPKWSGVLGMAAGAAGIGLGLDRLGDGGASGRLGAVNAGIGALAMGVGAWTLFAPREDRAVVERRPPAETGATLTASPLIGADGGSSLGVLFRLGF